MSSDTLRVVGVGIFVGLGVILMVVSVILARVSHRAQHWPSAPATILRSDVARRVSRGADNRRDEFLEFDVEYEYEVGGRRYVGTTYRLSGREIFGDGTEEMRKYPVGAVVPVRYDPADPEGAVLEVREPPGRFGCMFLGGILFVVLGLMGLLAG